MFPTTMGFNSTSGFSTTTGFAISTSTSTLSEESIMPSPEDSVPMPLALPEPYASAPPGFISDSEESITPSPPPQLMGDTAKEDVEYSALDLAVPAHGHHGYGGPGPEVSEVHTMLEPVAVPTPLCLSGPYNSAPPGLISDSEESFNPSTKVNTMPDPVAVPVPLALQGPCNSAPPGLMSEISGQPYATPCAPLSATTSLARKTSVDDSWGWNALLEISRNSGTSGVMGMKCMVSGLVKSAVRGLKACQEPEKPRDGMGGTYFFLNDSGRKVAILKPCDEEPLAPNNPKGYVGRQLGDPGWKPTVRVGEAALREVAAYLLDDGYAKVPTSVLVRARHPAFCYNDMMMGSVLASCLERSAEELEDFAHEYDPPASPPSLLPMKLGSLQEFVPHECDTSEMGASVFCTQISSSSSDSLNCMHAHNKRQLIPIDHGFCLPETLEAPYFEWLHWPQSMQPFTEDELLYIKALDIEADKEMLRKELPSLRPECLRVLELGTTLLQRGAMEGLTLFEIASIMTRPYGEDNEEPSELEIVCARALQTIQTDKHVTDKHATDKHVTDKHVTDKLVTDKHVTDKHDRHGKSPAGHQNSTSLHSSAQEGWSCAESRLWECGSLCLEDAVDAAVASMGSALSGRQTRPAGEGGMAASVCGTDGFLYRQMNHRRRNNAIRKQHSSKPGPLKHVPSRPVLTAGPDSGAVNFRDMNEDGWSMFMSAVHKQLLTATQQSLTAMLLFLFPTE
eukprot:gene23283-30518_t